jgi:hypothetical protein
VMHRKGYTCSLRSPIDNSNRAHTKFVNPLLIEEAGQSNPYD